MNVGAVKKRHGCAYFGFSCPLAELNLPLQGIGNKNPLPLRNVISHTGKFLILFFSLFGLFPHPLPFSLADGLSLTIDRRILKLGFSGWYLLHYDICKQRFFIRYLFNEKALFTIVAMKRFCSFSLQRFYFYNPSQ